MQSTGQPVIGAVLVGIQLHDITCTALCFQVDVVIACVRRKRHGHQVAAQCQRQYAEHELFPKLLHRPRPLFPSVFPRALSGVPGAARSTQPPGGFPALSHGTIMNRNWCLVKPGSQNRGGNFYGIFRHFPRSRTDVAFPWPFPAGFPFLRPSLPCRKQQGGKAHSRFFFIRDILPEMPVSAQVSKWTQITDLRLFYWVLHKAAHKSS